MANQTQTGKLVDREVLICASVLIQEATRGMNEGGSEYTDELENLLGGYVSCEDCDGNGSLQHECEACGGTGEVSGDDEEETECENCEGSGEVEQECESCEGRGENLVEVYEHWIVTNWLGEKLKERGEIVEEYCNLTIWGRQCSGQAILLDYVIGKIVDDLDMFADLA